nr:immunoglobulin heavy chain junction region [Mus musculus]
CARSSTTVVDYW